MKTCVVIGHSRPNVQMSGSTEVCESAVYGMDSHFPSAHDFIRHIQDLHKNNNRILVINSVVIG